MAWEARSGLKLAHMAKQHEGPIWLNGLGSPFGIETIYLLSMAQAKAVRLNGLGSPFGIETSFHFCTPYRINLG